MELAERIEEMVQGYEPDILLPAQYNELRRRSHELQGELKLMFAVLEDAIHCYLHHMNAKTRQRKILFYEVRDWMNSKHRTGLFAYETLCEALASTPAGCAECWSGSGANSKRAAPGAKPIVGDPHPAAPGALGHLAGC